MVVGKPHLKVKLEGMSSLGGLNISKASGRKVTIMHCGSIVCLSTPARRQNFQGKSSRATQHVLVDKFMKK